MSQRSLRTLLLRLLLLPVAGMLVIGTYAACRVALLFPAGVN